MKKIALVGLGVENIALLEYFARQGIQVAVLDRDEAVRKHVPKTLRAFVSEWRLGPSYLKDLTDFGTIFRTPGLPPETPELARAAKKGVLISSQTKLFFELAPCAIIGVTGTKGKGTTASLIATILKEAGRRVFLGGNIGKPPTSFLKELSPTDLVVLELSSFQLADLSQSPHIAVITTFFPDHLDYHRTLSDYERAKANIFRYQGRLDFAILPLDSLRATWFASLTSARHFWFSTKKSVDEGGFLREGVLILRIKGKDFALASTSKLPLIGEHNIQNALAASLAAFAAGARVSAIRRGLRLARPLPHRLELVKRVGGVGYINDSYSTVPEATVAAIESFREPLVLIAGGLSKGGDDSLIAKAVARRNVRAVITIGRNGQRLSQLIRRETAKVRRRLIIEELGAATMGEIVEAAATIAEPGDLVLFSPGAASFDMFENATERGEMFRAEVLELKRG